MNREKKALRAVPMGWLSAGTLLMGWLSAGTMLMGGLSAGTLLAPAAAHAQQASADPQEEQTQRREEVITVSATRLPVSLSDLPVAARAWQARELQDAPAIVLDEALRSLPAVSLFRRTSSRDSHPTAQGLNLRGLAPSGVSRALVLVDGVPMNDPFGGWVYWDRVPLLAIEQVEVALGGGSAPYGSQALGGVLQLVTRKQMDSSMQMQVLAGNESTVRFGIAAGGTFGGGSIFASAQLFNTAGYIATAAPDRGSVDTPIAANSQSARVRIDLRAGISINVEGLREARDNGTPLQNNNTSFGGINATWSGTTAAGSGGWNFYGLARTQEFDSSFSSVAADRDSERLVLVQRVPSTDFGAGGHGWTSWGGSKVSFGGDWRRVDGKSEELVIFSGATRAPGGTQNSGGGFGAIDLPASSALSLSAGLRIDGWNNTPSETTAGEPRSAGSVSPRAGLAWHSSNGLTLRGSGYGAFRAPTLNELYRQFRVGNVATFANPDLVEERLWGAEAGAGWSGDLGRGAALSLDGTFYWNHLDDAIINATIGVTPNLVTRRRENLGAATARGVELDARLDIEDNWTVRFAYAWLDSFIREAVPGTDPAATVGNRLPQVPTYRTRATLFYRAEPGWAASLSVAAVGEQFEDDLNELPLASAITVAAALEIPLFSAARATIRAENLFNENVEVRRSPVLAYGAPRLIYAGITLTWPD